MTDSAKKNNSPPSGQNSTVSLQRSPSPSSDEYEKVEKGTPSPSDSSRKDLWTKVDADGSHSGESQYPRSVTTISRTNSSLEPESEQDYDNAFDESERARPEEPLDISHFNTHLLKIDNVAPKSRQELYSKAFDIFSKVQSLRRKIDSTHISGSNPLMNKLAHYAEEYTNQLLGYYEYITQNKASEQDEKTYTKDVLRFWRLAEILCFSGNSDDVVTLELCAWLNTYWVEDDEDDEEEEEHVIVEKPSSEEGSDSEKKSSDDQKECRLQVEKWKLIQKHLLRGNIREAKGLMHHLSRKASPEIRAHLEQLVQLLSNLPQLPSNKASPGDFAKWNEWSKQRDDARQEYYRLKNNDNDDNSASEYLDDIYSIISGDDEAIARFGTFWERFAAALLYREPFRTRSDIVNTAEFIFPESKEKSSSVVYACHSLLMREWDDALGLFDDFWTQVHLGHLLMAANILGDRDLYVVGKDGSGLDSETATEPVYHIMNIYATHIAREYGMWKEAFTYIGACKTNRDYWACKLIDEMPKDDRQTLEKFLECSKDFQLVSAQRSLYKTMAECCEKDNDIATAIKCYSKAHDAASLDRLAHQIMKKFLDDGKLAEMPDEDDIDKEILGKCKHYAFLLKYKALQSCLDQDRSMEAARYIKDLLHSLDAPREFRAVLLMEALPLLVSEEESSSGNLVFNEQETEDLIKHFQDATQRGEIPKDVFVKQHKKFNAASSVQHLLKKVGHNLRYNLAKAIAES